MTDDPDESAATDTDDTATDENEAEESAGPTPVGVKLGSTRTVLQYVRGGEVETVRTLTCLATYEDPLTGDEQVLFGEQAAQEYPDTVKYMLRSGLPQDDESADLAAKFFEEVVSAEGLDEDSAVVYAIPTIDNEPGLRNLNRVIEQSSVGDALVRSFPESLCGSIPALGDDLEAIDEVFAAVNMGSTNLEASAYRHGEQLSPFVSGAVTGNEVDRKIANAVEEETQGRVNIDLTTAREYKETHADFDAFEPFTDVIQQPGGGAHEFTIERSVMEPLDDYVDDAVDEVANNFLSQLANDHMKPYQLALSKPIVLTGGMACIPGIVDVFEERLSMELDREVTCIAADRPDLAPAEGARRIAERLIE
ncbi:cell division protein FtsA [Halobellus marinus]|uniref:cell division protein FtsA n=1 Tax=Halobellus TaxID=1073986 RepID=UPI0028AB53A1|nr:cell division protein FtsA [Halobellus sp. DFY28]